ncbi:hypothetical protein SVAN01_08318 [Stagonosporopsis vannaccii]|nr:hypothetical protein SVAN01_08318 [Stagonosporopsis vannaccii]
MFPPQRVLCAERGEQVVLRWEQRDDKLRLLQPYLNSSPHQPPSLAQPFTFSGDTVFDPPPLGFTPFNSRDRFPSSAA